MNKRFERRKWGWYLTILDRKYFKIKILRFRTGKACSMQYHNDRSEMWLFLSGYGEMRTGEAKSQRVLIDPGTYVIISPKQKHQYVAVTKSLVVEIQYGSQCTEEDIIRV